MDEQLKKRMVGASIIIVLLIIIVPMFFEDKSKPLSEVNSLALPEAMDEKTADVQKTVRETSGTEAPLAQPVEKKTALKKGYTVVPLDDAAPKNKPAPKNEITETTASSAESGPTAQEALEAPEEPVEPAPPPAKPASVANVPVKPAAVATARIAETQKAPKLPEAQPKKTVPQAAVASIVAPKPKPPVTVIVPAAPKPQEPVVAKAPPANPTPAKVAPAQSSTATGQTFLVQAGSFSTESNAKLLVERLKKKNLPAQMSVAQTANGPVYRVTVGPNLNRAKAEQIQKDMAEQDGVKGMIMQAH